MKRKYSDGFFEIFAKFCICVAVFVIPLEAFSQEVNIYADHQRPIIKFATEEIAKAINAEGGKAKLIPLLEPISSTNRENQIVVILANNQNAKIFFENEKTNADSLKPEGFIIKTFGAKKQNIWVLANDEAGLMYGGQELAERILEDGLEMVKDQVQNPYMPMRGVKFNIPLDVRTPSYSDVSDAAQKNIAEMWNLDFWKEFIDSLARFRYNYISLWNLHPFPSMVRVPDYPEIALDDVHRSTVQWKENYNTNAIGFDAPEIVNNFEVIRKMTIDEKMDFWRKVMAYGKERNVDFYVVTWNIFTNGTFGKYGITDKIENHVTTDYFRKSVRQMFLEYPDLAGIGLTTGENMYQYSNQEKEDWAFNTYGQAVLDVAKEQSGRKITFIHRQHQTGALDIARKFTPLIENPDINFIFSFKYAQAHVYSSVNQVFHQDFVNEIRTGKNLKTVWTLRNDDIFHFRWAAPDFVRKFVKNIPYDVSEGYYYGSDQYVWGRDFLSKNDESPRQLEIAKHWFQWMLWGRLGYNPEMSNEQFCSIIKTHFQEVDAAALLETWQNASMVYPLVTGFHWGALDFQWYIEGCQSRADPAQTPSGYHDINRFISLPPHKGTNYISIPEYVKAKKSGTEPDGTSPFELASSLLEYTDKALAGTDHFMPSANEELAKTMVDIQSISYLGKYYAYKILAATYLQFYRETSREEYKKSLIENLRLSALNWRYYSSVSLSNYQNPLWTNRVGLVDWRKNYRYVLYDITANGGSAVIESMLPTKGGRILEAEAANIGNSSVQANYDGYTGTGYVEFKAGDARQNVEWEFNAPEDGNYILEFRYSLKRQEEFESPVIVNGKNEGDIIFWTTGASGTWVWDRINIRLTKGNNRIKILPEGFVMLDHLNIIKE